MSRTSGSVLVSSRGSTSEPDEMNHGVSVCNVDAANGSLPFSQSGIQGPSFHDKYGTESFADGNKMISADSQTEKSASPSTTSEENNLKHGRDSKRTSTGELDNEELCDSECRSNVAVDRMPFSKRNGTNSVSCECSHIDPSAGGDKMTSTDAQGEKSSQKLQGRDSDSSQISSIQNGNSPSSSSETRAHDGNDEGKYHAKKQKYSQDVFDSDQSIQFPKASSPDTFASGNEEEGCSGSAARSLAFYSPSRSMSLCRGETILPTPPRTRSQIDRVGPLHQVDVDCIPVAERGKAWSDAEDGGEVLWDPLKANQARESRFDFESVETFLFDPQHSLPVKTLMMEALHRVKYDPTKVMGEFVQLVKDKRSRGNNHDIHLSDEEQEQLESLVQSTEKSFRAMSKATGHSMDAVQVWYYGWKGGKDWTP